MLAREDQYIKAYEAVKEELLSQTELERKIPIFVSIADCDSICALRILVVRDSLPSQFRPYPFQRSFCPLLSQMSVWLVSCRAAHGPMQRNKGRQ